MMQLLRSKRFWIALTAIGIFILIRMSGIADQLSLANIKAQREWLELYVANHYWKAALIYIVTYFTTVTLSLPVGAVLTMVSGFLFGVIGGVVFANIGATLGAITLFLLVRYFVGNSLQERYKEQLKDFNEHMHKEGTSYLLLVRFIVVIPFFVVNMLSALTNVPLRTFIWTTSLGIIPASFAFAFAGQQLMHIDYVSDVFSWQVIMAFVLLITIALVPILVKRYRK